MQRSRFIIVVRTMGGQARAEGGSIFKRRGEPLACTLWLLFSLIIIFPFYLQFLSVRAFAQEDLKLSYEKAQELFEHGKSEDAAAAFRSLLARTYQDRAGLYQQEGLLKDAAADLAAASSLAPDSRPIEYDLAYTEFRLQHYHQAASLLERLIAASPNDPSVHALLGKAYLSLNNLQAARRELQLALRLNPDDYLTAYTLALADLTSKDQAAAERIFAQLGKRLGTSARFHLVIGRAYSDTGYQEAARRELGRALAIDPKTRYAHYLLAIALLREMGTGATEQSMKELRQECRLFPDEFEAQYLLGVLLAFQRRFSEASKELHKAIQLSPQQPEPYFYLGNVYLDQGDPRQALEALTRGMKVTKEQGGTRFPLYRAHLLLSRTYRAVGEHEASVREAREAGRLANANSGLHDREPDAGARLRESLAGLSAPSSTVTWKDPSLSEPLTDSQKKLLSVYGQVLVSGRSYLARIAVSEGKFNEAARQFAEVRKLQPDNPEVDYRLGLALYKAGQFPQALKPLEQAVARSPDDPSAAKYLGLTYFELGRYDDAVKPLQQARSSSPNDPEVLLALGGALARTHHDNEAQNILAQLLKSHPDSAAVHILLGKAYAAQGQAPQAEQEFRRALDLNPKAPSAHLYLGTLMLQNGRMAEAGKEFQDELQIRPAASEARYNLAFVLLKQQKVAEAIPLLRQVIQEEPGYAEAHYSLGKALLEQGNAQEAISELKMAVQLAPMKAYAHYQLGRAYLQAGRRKEAQQEFELTRNLKDQQLKFPTPQPGSTP